ALVNKGSAPPVRRQPLLRPSPLRRLPVDRQSRSPILDHLRPTSRSRHLSPLLAARPDTGDRALREGTARPTARRPSIANPTTPGHPTRRPRCGVLAQTWLKDRALPRQIDEINEL